MVKRELAADLEINEESPRSKRLKDGTVEPSTKDETDASKKVAASEHEDDDGVNAMDEAPAMSPEEVREEGLKVLQMLRDTVNKEGRQISYEFLRLPSKRQFSDYYEIIERPIALDDIKTQLEDGSYSSLEALRADLETCFKNARRYNQRESVIWRDAKTLQKRAFKEIDKAQRKGNDDNEGSDKESGKKKEKGTNIHRLMKNRLQKLVEKEDESGRRLSYAFMDLPSKKKWPLYYKLIKQPICIEDIFKRIKRKEYHTIQDFIDGVHLVFDNALSFNEDHSPIWEDALTLKTYFQHLMTSLPAKYNMNGTGHSSESPEIPHNKIKLKLPGHQHIAAGSADSSHNAEASASGTVRLRVPGLGGSGSGGTGGSSGAVASDDKTAADAIATPALKKDKSSSPDFPVSSLPSAASIPHTSGASALPSTVAPGPVTASAHTAALAMPTPKPAKAATPAHAKPLPPASTPSQQQQHTAQTTFHHYTTPNHIPPQNFYAPSAAGTSMQAAARRSATPASSIPHVAATIGRTDAPSPIPPASAAGLYSVRLECCPPGKSERRRRLAILDSQAGVRNFAVRVPVMEARLIVRSVKLANHDEDDVSETEETTKVVQTPMKRRGRGRPKKVVSIDQEVKPPEPQEDRSSPAAASINNHSEEKKEKRDWCIASSSEVEMKLDGQEVTKSIKDAPTKSTIQVNGNAESSPGETISKRSTEPDDEWAVDLTAGHHVLEIERRGNSVPWRVYLTVT